MYHTVQIVMVDPCDIQLLPTINKRLFMSSFQVKFLKIRFTKVATSNTPGSDEGLSLIPSGITYC